MKETNEHFGWLKTEIVENDHETITLDGEPIADELSYISGNFVTVRYYLSDKEATKDELVEDFLINTLYGNMESEYGARYSEYTGYLWTDDNLRVGGHDLLSELGDADGKYLYMIIELDKEKYNEKKQLEKERLYSWSLISLMRHAKELDKGLDEIAADLKRQ